MQVNKNSIAPLPFNPFAQRPVATREHDAELGLPPVRTGYPVAPMQSLELVTPGPLVGAGKTAIAGRDAHKGAGAALVTLGVLTIAAGFVGAYADRDGRSTYERWVGGFLGSFLPVGGILVGSGAALLANRAGSVGKGLVLSTLGALTIAGGMVGAFVGSDGEPHQSHWIGGFLGTTGPIGGALLGAGIVTMARGASNNN